MTQVVRRGDIRHVKDVTLHPSDLDVAIWYNPRRTLYERSKTPLYSSDEFDERFPITELPHQQRWAMPLAFHVFDVAPQVARRALEWQKMRVISGLASHAGFMQPWMPMAIYEAHRKGVIDVLSHAEDHTNTFYVQKDFVTSAVDIEVDEEDKDIWRIHALSLGDDQIYPHHQRIFVGF